MAETYSAGVVTAYGAAVRGGYTGTYEEFCAEQAEFAENAAAVAQAKEDVETMQGQVEQAAATFTDTTVPAAVTTVQEAGAAQVQAVQSEGTMQAEAVETVGAQQTAAVGAAGSDAVDAVEAAETAATDAVTAAQTAAVQAVQTESTTQQAAIQTKGQETIASIPEDYTALSGEVDDLKSAINTRYALPADGTSLMSSGDDFNDYKTPGNYRIGSSAVSKTLLNAPPIMSTGRLTVVELYLANRLLQRIDLLDDDMTVFTRGFDGTTWTPWRKVCQANADAYADFNIPAFAPVKANDECIPQIIKIANSYCGVGVQYKANNGPFFKLNANHTGIQCSQFINCLLQGLMYTDSKLYSNLNTNKLIDGGCKRIDIEPYKSDNSGCMSAAQLAQYAYENWFLKKTNILKETEPGDVLFFAEDIDTSGGANWENIFHVAMVVKREGHKTIVVNAGNIVPQDGLVDTVLYHPGAETDAVCYQTILDDETVYHNNTLGTGLYGFARFDMYYQQPTEEIKANLLSAFITVEKAPASTQLIDDGADNIPVKSITINPGSGYSGSYVKLHRYGKNILSIAQLPSAGLVINGVTWTVEKDEAGNVTALVANGTAQGNSVFNLVFPSTVPEADYYVVGLTAEGSASTFNMFYRTQAGGYNLNSVAGATRHISSITAVQCIVYDGYTANNVRYRPMICLSSEADKTFEPFKGKVYNFPVADGSIANYYPKPQVTTLSGRNYFWAESGTVGLIYRADTKLYIDKLVNA